MPSRLEAPVDPWIGRLFSGDCHHRKVVPKRETLSELTKVERGPFNINYVHLILANPSNGTL